ncbi:MAG: hypothetical protein JW806_10135 [Sedimentisphaerales bacterium]|nr:hypothetical protein [Sedimentisphaerales bacterium]
MDAKIEKSWEKCLHPDILRTNLVVASIYITAYELLEDRIIDKIQEFFTYSSPEYETKVLSLHKKRLKAHLLWLKDMKAIDETDIQKFKEIKKCRNTLTHEMLKFIIEGINYDLTKLFSEMIELIRKIELWWFKSFEMETNPEVYPKNLDLNEVVTGPMLALQMTIDVALGPNEEAEKYYEYVTKNRDNRTP